MKKMEISINENVPYQMTFDFFFVFLIKIFLIKLMNENWYKIN